MSFRLNYDPALLTFKSLDKGPALPNAMLDKSLDEKADPGKLGLGFACSSKAPGSKEMASIEQDGVVLTLVFVVNDKAAAGKKCALTLDNYRALDSADPPFELPVQPVAGEFTVTGPGLPWLWILIGAGGVLLLILLLALTRGKKKEPAPALAGVAPWQSPSAPVPSYQPVGGTFAHTCVKCHGVIQLPVAMFGQAFQCGACGTKQLAGPRGQ